MIAHKKKNHLKLIVFRAIRKRCARNNVGASCFELNSSASSCRESKKKRKDLRTRLYKRTRKRLENVTTEKTIPFYFPLLNEVELLIKQKKNLENGICCLLEESREEKHTELTFTQNINLNKLPKKYLILKKLLQSVLQNEEKHSAGIRHEKIVKKFAAYIYMIAGRLSYETLSANLPLSSITSVTRYVCQYRPCIVEGKLRSNELRNYLIAKNVPLVVWISEDATGIVNKVQYDPRTNQLVGLVLPLQEKNWNANT